MTGPEKQKLEAYRQEGAMKTMYYSRYFMVRYVVVAFFFANLHWLLALYMAEVIWPMLLPAGLVSFGAFAVWEQFRMYTVDQKEARTTKRFFALTILVNSVMIILAILGQQTVFYPFFKQGQTSLLIIIGITAVGILLSLWMLRKISRIDQKIDKQYGRISRYIASLKS